MSKKFLTAAATAAALSLAGFAASASAMPVDTTTATDPIVDLAGPGKVTLSFDQPDQSVDVGEDVTLTVTATNNTGNPNPDVIVTLSEGCGSATTTPSSFEDVFKDGDTVTLTFTVSGLTEAGTCEVSVTSNHGGTNFDTNAGDTVTITVGPEATTTTAAATTTTEAESAVPVAGGNSGALAMMALGFVLIGYATIAATRRRRTA